MNKPETFNALNAPILSRYAGEVVTLRSTDHITTIYRVDNADPFGLLVSNHRADQFYYPWVSIARVQLHKRGDRIEAAFREERAKAEA